MSFYAFCKWLQHSSLGVTVSESLWLFPLIETIHVFGIVILVGSTAMLDLRLLGLMLKRQPVSQLSRQVLHWAWAGFSVMVITGALMFASEAAKMYVNGAFQFKMLLILLAGINALVFHFTVYRKVDKWDNAAVAPLGARFAGCASLILWAGVVAAGRWIAYW